MDNGSCESPTFRRAACPATVVCLLVVALPWVYGRFPDTGRYAVTFFVLGMAVLSVVWTTVSCRRQAFVLRRADAALSLYLLWGIANLCLVRPGGCDPLLLVEWAGLLICYLAVRLLPRASQAWVLRAVVFSGVLQSLLGLLQRTGGLSSAHRLFPVTGSFLNPGPYGGYLAIAITAAVGLAIRARRSGYPRRGWLWTIAAIPMASMLVVSSSRAAWIGVLAGAAFIVSDGIRLWPRRRTVAGGAAVLVALPLLFAGIYLYKKDSADARLLIWRVSAEMFREHPVAGSGIATFPSRYMPAQRDYFARNPESRFRDIAGNNRRPFNEPIRIGCEQGIVGLGLFAGWIALVLAGRRRREEERIARGGVVALVVFSLFSYTADVLPLKLFFGLLAGMAPGARVRTFGLRSRLWSAWPAAVSLSAWIVFSPFYADYRKAEECLAGFRRTGSESDLGRFRDKLSVVGRHTELVWTYCRSLYETGRYRECTEAMPRLHRDLIVTPESLCDLGICYGNLGQYRKAARCFTEAEGMVPEAMYPSYCLFRLARQRGEAERAADFARRVAGKRPRVVNSLTLRMRSEANRYLRQREAEGPSGARE